MRAIEGVASLLVFAVDFDPLNPKKANLAR